MNAATCPPVYPFGEPMLRSLTELNIHNLRNISTARLSFHPQLNFFYGENGSGKTSLLEAIYLLSSGHSFRTREISPLVREGENTLTVFARTSMDETISIQKTIAEPTQVRLNMQSCYSSSELAHFLPSQVFYQDIFQIIDSGPSVRRTLLDWGLFHVEHSYHALWKKYRLVLKHLNALLRQNANAQQFTPWNKQLVELALELHILRSDYFRQWNIQFQMILSKLTDIPCSISYYKGWDKKETGKDLETILQEQFPQDLNRQYTQSGAHQADIQFDLSSKKAKMLLSRGQQKMVLVALKLAQASLVKNDCIYLFDDIASELDAQHFSRFMQLLPEIKGQIFLTVLDELSLKVVNRMNNYMLYSIHSGSIELKKQV